MVAQIGCLLILLVASGVYGQGLNPSSYITQADRSRLQNIFESAQPYQTTSSLHYSVLGLKLLGVTLPNQAEVCTKLKSLVGDTVESLFHAAVASQALTKCKITVSEENKRLLVDTVKLESTVVNIFYAYLALKYFGFDVDDKHVKAVLSEALKKDDTPLSYGYAFHVASLLTGDVSVYYESIEDVVAQADEVDDKYLQFEGGLFVTSLVIDGAYKLATTAKKMPTISDNKVLKFINYLLGRKNVHQLRGSYHLLSAINTLAYNKFYTPIAVTLASAVAVTEKAPIVQVRVTDLMGGSVGDLAVTAENARHLGDDAVIVSKKKFTPSAADKSLFELGLLDVKPARGFYNIEVSVQRSTSTVRLLGNTGAVVQVKVTTRVELEGVEIGVGDSDQTTAPRTTKLQHPHKAVNVLEADHHQKIIFKFRLRDLTSGKLMTAHQSFVRMVNKDTKQEITFVAEADAAMLNTFDLDIGQKGKEFGHLSGDYSMELIVGDVSIDNSFTWLVADVKLLFQEDVESKNKAEQAYSKKPEIKHMFRQQEKRPPAAVSNAFTVLALVPIAVLLILWLRIGANLSNFPFSVSALAFHGCLAAIFVLYFLYWYNLNMFETLQYLCILIVPTFLFGNRLLSTIAARKK